MANLSSILSVHPYVPLYDNKIVNLQAFFTHGFDILIANPDLVNKWDIHRLNICTATIVEDYELWIYIPTDFNMFKEKYFDMLDNSIWRYIW